MSLLNSRVKITLIFMLAIGSGILGLISSSSTNLMLPIVAVNNGIVIGLVIVAIRHAKTNGNLNMKLVYASLCVLGIGLLLIFLFEILGVGPRIFRYGIVLNLLGNIVLLRMFTRTRRTPKS